MGISSYINQLYVISEFDEYGPRNLMVLRVRRKNFRLIYG